MDGRVVVVAGGTGVAGECVVRELLARKATVVVPSRSQARLDQLVEWLGDAGGRLRPVLGDLGDVAQAEALRAAVIDAAGEPDAVVASLGGWWEGEQLVDVAPAVWEAILRDNLTAHFMAARIFLPGLAARHGVYLMLGGIAADLAVAGAGPISVTGAAQRMLLRTLAQEEVGRHVRLHELAILTPIVTHRWAGEPPRPGWLTGEQVGRAAADLVEHHSDHLLHCLPPDFVIPTDDENRAGS
ncbi:MAG TPA: SDR family NAD(P)-dependent oxidoreductase [Pseudonocardiaceae bacterium]